MLQVLILKTFLALLRSIHVPLKKQIQPADSSNQMTDILHHSYNRQSTRRNLFIWLPFDMFTD